MTVLFDIVEGNCARLVRRDIMQQWSVPTNSTLCDLFLPFDSAQKIAGFKRRGESVWFYFDGRKTSEFESWHTTVHGDHGRYGITLFGTHDFRDTFIFEITQDSKLWYQRVRTEDHRKNTSTTIMFVSEQDFKVEGQINHIVFYGSFITIATICGLLALNHLQTLASIALSTFLISIIIIQLLVSTDREGYLAIFGAAVLCSITLGGIANIQRPRQSLSSALLSNVVTAIYLLNTNPAGMLVLLLIILLHLFVWKLIAYAKYPNDMPPDKVHLRLYEFCSFYLLLTVSLITLAFSYPFRIPATLMTGSFYPSPAWELGVDFGMVALSASLLSLVCSALTMAYVRRIMILDLPVSVEDPCLMISNLV